MANLQKFVDEPRRDDEEVLAVEAAKKVEMEKELFRLVRLVERSRSEGAEGISGTLMNELLRVPWRLLA